MATPTNLANEIKVGHGLDQWCSVKSGRLASVHQNFELSWRQEQSLTFEAILSGLSHRICLISMGQNKTHSEWVLWDWSSLWQLKSEPTGSKSLISCKVPSDLMKINIKVPMHIGFYYKIPQGLVAILQMFMSS